MEVPVRFRNVSKVFTKRQMENVLLIVVSMTLVLLVSLLVLVLLGRVFHVSSIEESNIGQSYTGIATLLSAGALFALVVSVRLQLKQTEISQRQISRDMQFKLMTLALENPLYAKLHFSSEPTELELERFRIGVYGTLMFRQIEFSYLSGELSEYALRRVLRHDIFKIPSFRQRWKKVSPLWHLVRDSALETRFVELLDEELARVEASSSSENDGSESQGKSVFLSGGDIYPALLSDKDT